MTREEIINDLESQINKCQKCRLYKEAQHAVPGEGNFNSSLIFIGEAPGAREDATGRPFVGRAGKLLDSMLFEIGMKREDIWIGNIIKHRPPQNRDPLPDEIKACEKYLEMQIKAIAPKLVVTLGRFSMNYFLPEAKISRDRGKPVKYEDVFIYPVFHPAAALRNPVMMKGFKEDFLRIPEVLSQVADLQKD